MLKMNDIIKDGNPILRAIAKDVELPLSKEDEKTIKSLLGYVRDSQDEEKIEKHGLRPSVGIAAPQIGISKKMFVCRITYGDSDDIFEYALINPKLISHAEQLQYLEGGEACLSVTETVTIETPRYNHVTIKAYDYITKTDIKLKVRGYEAIVIQHELDHLSGIMFTDTLKTTDELDAMGAIPI